MFSPGPLSLACLSGFHKPETEQLSVSRKFYLFIYFVRRYYDIILARHPPHVIIKGKNKTALTRQYPNSPLKCSVHIRNEPPPNNIAVPIPVLAVLGLAVVLIPELAVDQQHSEVSHVEVRYDVREPAGEGPRQSHDEVPHVVGVPAEPPPPRHDQLGASLGRQGLEVLHGGVVRVPSELVLLTVGTAEYRVADQFDQHYSNYCPPG